MKAPSLLQSTQYHWLTQEPGPKMLIQALKLYGTHEKSGPDSNPEILAWASECGIDYRADATPWCGLFMAVIARRAGKPIAPMSLRAKNWQYWGYTSINPALGDVLIFTRKGGGHVGLYVGEDADCYHVLGGNQGDAVSITRIKKTRLYKAQRLYKNGVPANVRRILLSPVGGISENEQ